MNIEVLSPNKEWDLFVKDHSSLLFYYSAWGKVIEEGYGEFKGKVNCYVYREGNEIVCGTIGVVLNFKFIKIFVDNIPYGGLLGDAKFFSEFIGKLEQLLKKNRIHQIRMTSHYFNKFEEHKGYKAKPAVQHIVDLEKMTCEDLWANYSSQTRWSINKARKSDLSIQKITSEKEIDDFYSLYKKTMRRNRSIGYFSKEHFISIYNNLVSCGQADIFFVLHNNIPVSSMILLFSDEYVIDYLSVSDEKYHKFRANDLLLHTVLCNSIKDNRKYFDFSISEIYDSSLIKYKEKWGALNHEFFYYSKNFSTLRCQLWDCLFKIINSKFGNVLYEIKNKIC